MIKAKSKSSFCSYCDTKSFYLAPSDKCLQHCNLSLKENNPWVDTRRTCFKSTEVCPKLSNMGANNRKYLEILS